MLKGFELNNPCLYCYRTVLLFLMKRVAFLFVPTEKIILERELDLARLDLDEIEKARDDAERKLRLLMGRCGVDELTSSRGGSISALPSDVDEVNGNNRRTSCMNGNAHLAYPSPSIFPATDDDVFVNSFDSDDVVLSPINHDDPTSGFTYNLVASFKESKVRAAAPVAAPAVSNDQTSCTILANNDVVDGEYKKAWVNILPSEPTKHWVKVL
jgi:hypothetical protein